MDEDQQAEGGLCRQEQIEDIALRLPVDEIQPCSPLHFHPVAKGRGFRHPARRVVAATGKI
ncbi:MAG: hypothetical protein AB7P20_07415 [Rhizobiaceae bacterium]